MIRQLFLPEELFGRQIIPIKHLGIALDASNVFAVIMHKTSNGVHLTDAVTAAIPIGQKESYQERAAHAISTLINTLPIPDKISIAVPSSLVFFNEHTIPLTDPEKIRQVLPLEIEDKLPITLDESIIDFIITKQDEGLSQLLVAAIRKTDLHDIMAIYEQATINPTIISIDLFALHSVYQQIEKYVTIPDGASLVDMGTLTTRVSFLQDGVIRLSRTIPKGYSTLIGALQDETSLSETEVTALLENPKTLSHSENSNKPEQIVKQICINYLNDIQFTLNSYSQQLKFYGAVNQITFAGRASSIAQLDHFATTVLQTPCAFFSLEGYFSTHVINKTSLSIQTLVPYCGAIGLARPAKTYQHFSFQRGKMQYHNANLAQRQIKTALIIIGALFGLLILSGIFQMYRLSAQKKAVQQRALAKIKPTLLSSQNNILDWQAKRQLRRLVGQPTTFLSRAERYISQAEDSWLVRERSTIEPLKTLILLNRTIDRATYNITVQAIQIARNEEDMIEASVSLLFKSKATDENDWHAFARFKNDLAHSRYFTLGNFKEELGEDGGVQVTLPLTRKQS